MFYLQYANEPTVIELKFYKKSRDRLFKVFKDSYFNGWFMKISFNKSKQKFEYAFGRSLYVKGDTVHYSCSLDDGSALIGTKDDNLLLIIDNLWRVVQKIETPSDFFVSQERLLPGFNLKTYPFAVYHSKHFYYVVNVKNLHIDKLIQGSSPFQKFSPRIIMMDLRKPRENYSCKLILIRLIHIFK